MGSKQLNFFIVPEDRYVIDAFLKANDCVSIRNNVKDPTIDLIDHLGEKETSQFFLSKEDFKEEIFFNQVEEENYYYVDVLQSLAIEFDIGGLYSDGRQVLHRSRFYCITSYNENGKIVNKDEAFVKWMNRIFKRFQANFLTRREDYMDYYFSKKAIEWIIQNNAKLVEGGLKLIAADYIISK
jgi:hypothetical protein